MSTERASKPLYVKRFCRGSTMPSLHPNRKDDPMNDTPRSLCAVCFHRFRVTGSKCERCATGRTPAPTVRRTITIPTTEATP